MINWFNSLAPRERTLVTYGSILVFFILLWLLALRPIFNNKITVNKNIAHQKATLATMKKQSIEIKQLQLQNTKKPKASRTRNPQQLIEKSLQTWRLKSVLERMQSQGTGVRLILKNANADRVMRFLHELESVHSLSISDMSIDSGKQQIGFADFRLTIQSESAK